MKKRIKKIPFRQELFWDVDPKTIDPKRHARYIIERILDFENPTKNPSGPIELTFLKILIAP